MSSGEFLSTPQVMLPIEKIDESIAEGEIKHRTDLMKAENLHWQTIYEDEKKRLDELMKCEDYKKKQYFFKTEFTKLNDYIENLKQDVTVINEQYNFHGEKLALVKHQEQVSELLAAIKEQDAKIEKFQSDNKGEEQSWTEIRSQRDSIENEIFQLENLLIVKRCKNTEYENFQVELKEEEDKKLENENVLKGKKKEKSDFNDVNSKDKENHENKLHGLKKQIEELNLKIAEKRKREVEMKELEKFLKTLEEQRKSKLDDEERIQAEQTAELTKFEKLLKISEEKLENCEKNYEEICKSNDLPLISFKETEESRIEEILKNYEESNEKKNVELEELVKELNNLRQFSDEEHLEKQKKLEEAENLLQERKNKIEEDKGIIEEKRQKIKEMREKLTMQMQEKQGNLQLQENAETKKNELKSKIEELKNENYQETEKIALLENMKKDSLEVAENLEDALEVRKNLIAEETELKETTEEKLKFIENGIINETREFNDSTLALETEIQVNAKNIAQMKREIKKRDDKEMKKERTLREKLKKLQEEVKKVKAQNQKKKDEYKFEEIETNLMEDTRVDSLKSILKPLPATDKMEVQIESKSPRKVQFDIESDESTLSQFPLTQRRLSP